MTLLVVISIMPSRFVAIWQLKKDSKVLCVGGDANRLLRAAVLFGNNPRILELSTCTLRGRLRAAKKTSTNISHSLC
jgi:hypothetical protein